MSKFSRYDNGYGYRFNCLNASKKIKRLLKTKHNSLYHYIRANRTGDIIEIENGEKVYCVSSTVNMIAIISEFNLFKNAMSFNFIHLTTLKSYKIIVLDMVFFVQHNIDIIPILYHEIKHILLLETEDIIGLNYIEIECLCDKYAVEKVGADRVLSTYKKLASASNIDFNKPNGKIFKYRMDRLELLKNKGDENNEKISTENTKKFLTEL